MKVSIIPRRRVEESETISVNRGLGQLQNIMEESIEDEDEEEEDLLNECEVDEVGEFTFLL